MNCVQTLAAIGASLWLVTSVFAQDDLTNLAAIRELPPEKAAEQLPVKVDVVITYFDLPKESGLFVHDGNDGIYLKLDTPENIAKAGNLKLGSRLHLRATTHQGDFIPRLTCQSFDIVGDGVLPHPVDVGVENLFSPALDCQWVRFSGVLVGTEPMVDGQFVFVMELYGWQVKLLLPAGENQRSEVEKFMQRRVTVEGVAATVYNRNRQMTGRYFFVPSLKFIRPQTAESSSAPPDIVRVDQLLHNNSSGEKLVRLRGVVTRATPNEIFMRGQGGSLRVLTGGEAECPPGSQVEVVGFATLAPFRPELRAREIQMTGQVQPPKPVPLSTQPDELVNLQAELVAVRAEFLGQRENLGQQILQCRAGERLFEAVLPVKGSLPQQLVRGATLELIGICELTTTHPLPRSQWVDGFRIYLRSPDDLTILSLPSWWTPGRLLAGIAVLAGFGLAALGWGWSLRRRVAAQTEIIAAQVGREAVLNERRRLARDFHDTLEQELTGVAFQLDNAENRFEIAPDKARETLRLAKKMLAQSREEARTSISDLRSVLLEQGGLAAAMQETLPRIAAESSATFAFLQTGEARRLDIAAENHLLRMAREAVANTAHHADAAQIEVMLAYEADAVRLTIADNGKGFDARKRPPAGHFGLLGMQERAAKIGASLKIESSPNRGTTVNVLLPYTKIKSS